ncbi:acyl-CoA dehydrogenase family protein [Bacillus sp. SL00103]
MKSAGVKRLVRDAKLMEIGEGTSLEIQRLVIARQLLA